MDPLEELRADLQGGACVALVGAGVSVAVSGDPRASWPGLLTSGLEYAVKLGKLSADDRGVLQELLETSTNGGDLLDIASSLVEALGGPESPDFASWLRSDVGYLSVKDASLAESIGRLRIPIVTTNYDDLLEKCLSKDHVSWTQGPQFQLLLGKKSGDVGHLHGFWKEPKSIVLTREQYELMLADREMEFLRQAMAAVNSLVYIGFGQGISDPNFTHLRDWTRSAFPNQEMRNYRLCIESELPELLEMHKDERILPISYGSSHDELGGFLAGLASPEVPASHNGAAISGITLVEEQVRESAVLATHVRDAEGARITELLIPPVLLTVTHDQYVAAAKDSKRGRQPRCDLQDVLAIPRVLLSGTEHVGVTSALLWLCGQACIQDPRLKPVTIDFLQLGSGVNPLRRAVIKQLRSLGTFLADRDPLPSVLLILDNVHTGKPTLLSRVVSELSDPGYARVILGCRANVEAEVAEALNDIRDQARFERRYVGRLSKSDVQSLARLVDTGRSKQLTEKAVEVVRAHRLPSTPFTFSMIISALMRGESLLAMTSPTSLLDAYMDLLLGKGAPEDDSRYGLDAFNRAYILAKLAEHYVHRKAGALPQMDVVSALSETLELLDWQEVPVDILKDFQRRHILVLRGGEVSFAQSSYLHLFAAKRAQESAEMLTTLKQDALYYAPILSHYAALKRTDTSLLEDLMPLLDMFASSEVPRSQMFEVAMADAEPRSAEELEQRIVVEAASTPLDRDDDDVAPLDYRSDEDVVPFPLQPVDEEPSIARMMTTLGLLSNLLRDTEIVPDHEFRKRTLTGILNGWCNLVDRVEIDPSYEALSRMTADRLADEYQVSARHLERFTKEVVMFLPLSFSFAGIATSLSSKKLQRTLERCFADEAFASDPALSMLGNYMMSDIKTPGWSAGLMDLFDRHKRIFGVQTMFRRVLWFSYLRANLAEEDEEMVRHFLVEQSVYESGEKDSLQANRLRGRLTESYRKAKLQSDAQASTPRVVTGRPVSG